MNHNNILWYFLGGVVMIVVLAKTDLISLDIFPSGTKTEEADTGNDEKHGPVKTYDKFGNLHTLVNYDHGIKDGRSYIYYTNGQVMLEMNYVQGKREGESIKYYKNGKVYAITPYENDELTGIRKTYYQNGQQKGEIPYYRGYPGIGLKEYYTDGTVKELPQIRLKEVMQDGKRLLVFDTPDCNKVRFYRGSLYNNKYLIPDAEYVTSLPMEGDRSFMDISAIRGPVNLICDCTTKGSHPYVTRLVVGN